MVHRAALVRHLLGIAAPFVALAALSAVASITSIAPATSIHVHGLQIAAAIAAYLGVFMLGHELAHGALGLPRRSNALALAIAGICMMTSGHALRLMHLRHHARPLQPDDLEGVSARLPWWQALAAAPVLSVMLVVRAWRIATARDRAWQRMEHAAVAVLVAAAMVGPRALQIYVITSLAMQALAPLWAGHLPHRAPRWLRALARPLARCGSMMMTTLIIHDDHHRRPRLPAHQLRHAISAADHVTRSAPAPSIVHDEHHRRPRLPVEHLRRSVDRPADCAAVSGRCARAVSLAATDLAHAIPRDDPGQRRFRPAARSSRTGSTVDVRAT